MKKKIGENAKQCIKLYKKGVKQSEIARKLGLTRQQVHGLLQRNYNEFVLEDRTNPNLNLALQDYANGVKVEEIKQRYNISPRTIYEHARSCGIWLRNDARKLHIVELINAGNTPTEVSKITGYSIGIVYYTIRQCVDKIERHIIETTDTRIKLVKKDREKREQIKELLNANYSQAEIARQLGLSRQRVNQIVKEGV